VRSLIEFRLEDGTSVFVEAESSGREAVRGGRAGGLAMEAGETFESALARVQPAAFAIVELLRAISDAPEEIEVEFGIQLSAEVGAFVARASGDANFRVALRWSRNPKQPR
jgi:Trypsin-co-occurring domain 1